MAAPRPGAAGGSVLCVIAFFSMNELVLYAGGARKISSARTARRCATRTTRGFFN